MDSNLTMLIAEDDKGHEALLKKNLRNSGMNNRILSFQDGQALLDFLCNDPNEHFTGSTNAFLLLLDINMPKVDGIQVLKTIKEDERLKKIPVIVFTTTDDPKEIDYCYQLGCSYYITKPVDYNKFAETINRLGSYLKLIKIPTL